MRRRFACAKPGISEPGSNPHSNYNKKYSLSGYLFYCGWG